MAEQVLVLPRDHVPGGCDFAGVRRVQIGTLADLRDALTRHGRYLERPIAESRPGQPIPFGDPATPAGVQIRAR